MSETKFTNNKEGKKDELYLAIWAEVTKTPF